MAYPTTSPAVQLVVEMMVRHNDDDGAENSKFGKDAHHRRLDETLCANGRTMEAVVGLGRTHLQDRRLGMS